MNFAYVYDRWFKETFQGEAMKDFNDVLAFHEKFNLPRDQDMRLMSEDAEKFRFDFLVEEAEEFHEAWHESNLVKATDALLDFVYVAIGTALFIGCPRFGALGRWPSYEGVEQTTIESGLPVSRNEAPRLLTPGIQAACTMMLKDRLDFFVGLYDAAKDGEPESLTLSIHALKICCSTAYGIGVMMRLPWERCWDHVQRSNMGKKRAEQDGSDSKRRSPWDVVKPEGWKAPDAGIAMELQQAGWRVPVMMMVDNKTGKVEMQETSPSKIRESDPEPQQPGIGSPKGGT